LNRRLGGPQSQSGVLERRKKISMPGIDHDSMDIQLIVQSLY